MRRRPLFGILAWLGFGALLVGASACERGCLKRALPDVEGGVADPLSVVDCAPGVLRCRTGVVERHATATACATCTCPWVSTSVTCAQGCLAEDVEILRDESDAISLCTPRDTTFAPDPKADAGGGACTDEGARFQCSGGVVYACASGGAVPVASCSFGCVIEQDVADDDAIDVTRARSLMCLRHARRTDP
ncbi:hypothetical protein BH09MYX1_BH09MYX1_46750 [soil metagenome]